MPILLKFFDTQRSLNIHCGRVHKNISKDSEPDVYDKFIFRTKKNKYKLIPKIIKNNYSDKTDQSSNVEILILKDRN